MINRFTVARNLVLIFYRLSQAHCRLMYRTTILPMDAIIAVSLVDLSMQDCTLNDTVDALHSTFQKYPDFDYLCTAKKLLTRLNLYEIWKNELLFYGNLLQIDHKTLETDIENMNPKLFATYDDVTDNSIQLTASLITSSYFNNNKSDELEFIEKENNVAPVKAKLAATLKKHANLNKDEKKPPPIQKNKRKRKEVTVDTRTIKKKIARNKQSNKKRDTNDSSDDEFDDAKILKAVPSVNDVFADLGIDFKFRSLNGESSGSKDDESNIINEKSCDIRNKNIEYNDNQDNIRQPSEPNDDASNIINDKTCDIGNRNKYNDNQDKMRNENHIQTGISTNTQSNTLKDIRNIDSASPSKTLNKLQQFSFQKTHNFEKYDDKLKPVEKLHKTNSSSSKLSQNSQISIFESSDCDIELDI